MASVPVDERTLERLRTLRETIARETGREVTEREVIARAVEREFESREALVDSFRDPGESSKSGDGKSDDFGGLSAEERERWLSGTSESGDPVDEDEIDSFLYEEEASPAAERE
ncbi:MAG: hypothetical protein ABEJ40_10985 [Haloarculaceae archaeon]